MTEEIVIGWSEVSGIGALTFLLGLLLGHRLSLGRDRRKEFNEAAQQPWNSGWPSESFTQSSDFAK